MLIVLIVAAITTLLVAVTCGADEGPSRDAPPVSISGIYPHLAVFNSAPECGIGAVVPWAGRLWYVTYSPHAPEGSQDKLYSLDEALRATVHPESIGGTPANRMIHRESNQLAIGPYMIDSAGRVRVIPYDQMPGRPTATMRHLTDPADKVYFLAMEGELYEVDVNSLAVTRLSGRHPVAGSHAKGAYTSQGRVVIANNGEWGWYERWQADRGYDGPTGALAQFDGRQWQLVERTQYCEVTGPGGIMGAIDASEPIWATGWDRRSVILKLLDGDTWHTYRLPKATHTYDGGHGWHTEWPRIRQVAQDRLLMTMHGMFYEFPKGFCRADSSGIRPLSTYHKMVVDFCRWNDQLVLACNDASRFDNPLVGQAQSNLWLTQIEDLSRLGPPAGWGGPWVRDAVSADTPCDPFLIAGFDNRAVHLSHDSEHEITFALEVDQRGDEGWVECGRITVPAHGYRYHMLDRNLQAEWLRLRTDADGVEVTAFLHCCNDQEGRRPLARETFDSLADIGEEAPRITGIIRPRGANLGTLHLLAQRVEPGGEPQRVGYYEIGPDMRLTAVDDPQAEQWLAEQAGGSDSGFELDEASVVITDAEGRRFRLPRSHEGYDRKWPESWPRCTREVVTERSLMNCHGTIYELPRESSGGLRAIRPICTHGKMIADLCSWRGLLVLSGVRAGAREDGHYFSSLDGKAGLWFGNVDDLWGLGKPTGYGGPWRDTRVKAREPSDPYLMTGYDHKVAHLSHDQAQPVQFALEVDFTADGAWHVYRRLAVPPGEGLSHEFPEGFSAHWVRLRADRDCTATAQLSYD